MIFLTSIVAQLRTSPSAHQITSSRIGVGILVVGISRLGVGILVVGISRLGVGILVIGICKPPQQPLDIFCIIM